MSLYSYGSGVSATTAGWDLFDVRYVQYEDFDDLAFRYLTLTWKHEWDYRSKINHCSKTCNQVRWHNQWPVKERCAFTSHTLENGQDFPLAESPTTSNTIISQLFESNVSHSWDTEQRLYMVSCSKFDQAVFQRKQGSPLRYLYWWYRIQQDG